MKQKDNQLRWDFQSKGHYEVYFLMGKIPSEDKGYWIRYTLLSPKKGEPYSEVWSFYFDGKNPEKKKAIKSRFDNIQAKDDPFSIQIGSSLLNENGMEGRVEQNDQKMAWNLTWQDMAPPLQHFPHKWMYRLGFPKTKLVSPHPHLQVQGKLWVDSQEILLQNSPAVQSHIWGKHYAEEWTWGHCNTFEEDDKAFFEALSARIKIAGFTTPPLTIFVLYLNNQYYFLNTLPQWLRNHSQSEIGKWSFQGETNEIYLEGKGEADWQNMVGAEYTSPNGEKRYCHNTALANLELKVELKKEKEELTLTAKKNSCSVEWVRKTKDSRVKLWV
ncbi:MAG: hypothetical protein D6785_07540 [Planctomycetota bacterium]|nr:MAG: hypothetical protein D6785_07540 [Planctomycetota bacterium]